ncbi:MAG: RagB/SusD family nutrient uptake outer membrane protein, partial [Duncaniella sp.]|nr:RagB/SusD family nutrient uptake outer membrane protein [Duncaniella sp.]
MKFRNILLAGLSAVALASCSDYLDVDAPSKLDPDYVYTDKQEMRNALNGVYASMLSKDTYGQAFLEKLCFNTDVDFNVTSSESDSPTGYRRYECKSSGGDIKKAWDALYTGIE